jgi:hypothetical protein
VEVESILNGYFSEVALSELWHVVDGLRLFIWVCSVVAEAIRHSSDGQPKDKPNELLVA